MNQIEIPLSKFKLFLGIGGSILFVILGLFMIMVIPGEQTQFTSMVIKGAGILSVVFFTITGIYGVRKISDKKIGLILDETGITDNSSGVSAGFIAWNEITSICTAQIRSTRFLLIQTINPEKYPDKKNRFKRMMMRMNLKMYGTPISISSNALQLNFEELEQLVQTAFKKYK